MVLWCGSVVVLKCCNVVILVWLLFWLFWLLSFFRVLSCIVTYVVFVCLYFSLPYCHDCLVSLGS